MIPIILRIFVSTLYPCKNTQYQNDERIQGTVDSEMKIIILGQQNPIEFQSIAHIQW